MTKITLNITSDLRDFLGEDVDAVTTIWMGREADPAVVTRVGHAVALLEAQGYEVDLSLEQYRCSGATDEDEVEVDGDDTEESVRHDIDQAMVAASELPYTEDELNERGFRPENRGTDGDVDWFDAISCNNTTDAARAEALFSDVAALRAALSAPAYRVIGARPYPSGPIATSAEAAWNAWAEMHQIDPADTGEAVAASNAQLIFGAWMALRGADISRCGGAFWRRAA